MGCLEVSRQSLGGEVLIAATGGSHTPDEANPHPDPNPNPNCRGGFLTPDEADPHPNPDPNPNPNPNCHGGIPHPRRGGVRHVPFGIEPAPPGGQVMEFISRCLVDGNAGRVNNSYGSTEFPGIAQNGVIGSHLEVMVRTKARVRVRVVRIVSSGIVWRWQPEPDPRHPHRGLWEAQNTTLNPNPNPNPNSSGPTGSSNYALSTRRMEP